MLRRCRQTALAAALLLFASVLLASTAQAQDMPPPDLDDAQWTSLFVRPYTTYTVVYDRVTAPNCDQCRPPIVQQEIEAVVLNGRLVSATDTRTGEQVDDGLTINDWFAEIQRAAEAGTVISGELNEPYGYPQAYEIETASNIITMRVQSFTWGAVRDFQVEQYEQAVTTWAENEPDAYEFDYQVRCGNCPPLPAVHITVRNGEVVAIETTDGSDGPIPAELRVTIDELLDRSRAAIFDPQTNDDVRFDRRYGYPSSLNARPSDPLIADGEYGFSVGNLRTLDPWPEVQAALDEARPKFTLSTYTLTYQRSCFCPNRDPIVVRVRDGEVLPAAGQNPDVVLTVPKMFRAIQSAITADVDRVTATFDPVLGYPTAYSVDQSFQIADEEYGVTVLSLVEGISPSACGGLEQGVSDASVSGRIEQLTLGVPDVPEREVLGATRGANTYTLDPRSYAEWCVNIETPGIYRLDASVLGSAQNADSFWVEIDDDNDVWHLPRSTDFKNATVRGANGQREFRLEAGEHRVRFYLRETGSLVESIRLVREGSLTQSVASCSPTIDQSARAGAVGNGAVVLSPDAVPGRSIALAVPDGVANRYTLDRAHYAEFCVTVERPAFYSVAATVLAADTNSNSFWIQVDDNAPEVWHVPVSSVLRKRQAPIQPVSLDAGEHRIRLYHREDTPVTGVTLEPRSR